MCVCVGGGRMLSMSMLVSTALMQFNCCLCVCPGPPSLLVCVLDLHLSTLPLVPLRRYSQSPHPLPRVVTPWLPLPAPAPTPAPAPGPCGWQVYNQLEVKDVDWDHALGGNTLDMLLAKHFAAQFADNPKLGAGVDVTLHPKAMAKMRRQVRRTKEMLSANSGAPCTVEELYDGKDFQVRGRTELDCQARGGQAGAGIRARAACARAVVVSGMQARMRSCVHPGRWCVCS